MKCLQTECPMAGRATCPAYLTCPEFKRCFRIRQPTTPDLQLSPAEAIDMYQKLGVALSFIPDFANPPKYWPSEKDPQPLPEELPKFYLIKSSGEVLKDHLTKGLEIWSPKGCRWCEENQNLLNDLIEKGAIIELQYPFRGETEQ